MIIVRTVSINDSGEPTDLFGPGVVQKSVVNVISALPAFISQLHSAFWNASAMAALAFGVVGAGLRFRRIFLDITSSGAVSALKVAKTYASLATLGTLFA